MVPASSCPAAAHSPAPSHPHLAPPSLPPRSYGNESLFVLLRLYQYVYERMAAARSCALQVRQGGARPGQICVVNRMAWLCMCWFGFGWCAASAHSWLTGPPNRFPTIKQKASHVSFSTLGGDNQPVPDWTDAAGAVHTQVRLQCATGLGLLLGHAEHQATAPRQPGSLAGSCCDPEPCLLFAPTLGGSSCRPEPCPVLRHPPPAAVPGPGHLAD